MKAYHFFIPSASSPINHAILITEYLSRFAWVGSDIHLFRSVVDVGNDVASLTLSLPSCAAAPPSMILKKVMKMLVSLLTCRPRWRSSRLISS